MGSTAGISKDAPIQLTAADEDKDRADAIKNLNNSAYLDWPNEAGVSSFDSFFHSFIDDTEANGLHMHQFENLTEHRGPIELVVSGTIPPWTAGSLFRNGPGAPGRKIKNLRPSSGQKDVGVLSLDHWFDGLAHIHRFDIIPSGNDQVKILYSSRTQTDEFSKYLQEKGSFAETISFGQRADPCVGMFAKMMSCYKAMDQKGEAQKYNNMNVTVQPAFEIPGLFGSKASPAGKSDSGTKTKTNGHHSTDTTSSGHRLNDKKLWVASDTSGLRALDANTLEPLGNATQTDLHPSLKGPISCAHAQRCPKTGDYFNYNIEVGPKAIYRIFRLSATSGKTDILATISRSDLHLAYIHSFFLSERFVVLRVPVAHIGKMGLPLVWKRNMVEAMEPFDKSKVCKWIVIDRIHNQGVVAEFETPAAFFFHSVNCWDELVREVAAASPNDDAIKTGFADIFCDVVDFPNTDILTKVYYDVILNKDGLAEVTYGKMDSTAAHNIFPSLVRWRFRVPLPRPTPVASSASPSKNKQKNKTVKPELVFTIPGPHAGELPVINPNFHTRQSRYVYSLAQSGKSTLFDSIIKTDTVTREVLQWNNNRGHTPGEAIFVPRPGGESEDDGVLLSVVLDGFSEKSYLLCLDAETMREIGRADLEFAVGIGLHGIHTPDDSLRSPRL